MGARCWQRFRVHYLSTQLSYFVTSILRKLFECLLIFPPFPIGAKCLLLSQLLLAAAAAEAEAAVHEAAQSLGPRLLRRRRRRRRRGGGGHETYARAARRAVGRQAARGWEAGSARRRVLRGGKAVRGGEARPRAGSRGGKAACVRRVGRPHAAGRQASRGGEAGR